jgi:ATP-dependent helicase HrpB
MRSLLEGLPIFPHLDSIADALLSSPSRFLVLTAETAAGKSTAVPVALLERFPGSIVMLEPRRVATVAVASRIAEILGEEVGNRAGYRLHLDSKVSRETRIEVITEAILTRRLQRDPALEGVSVVILDEFHERSVHADLALAFLRESVALRDDLYVIVMSATIDTERISAFLEAPVVSVPGRRWPVGIEYAPRETRRDGRVEPIEDAMAAAIRRELSREGSMGILAFLPGIAEIRRTERLLAGTSCEILALHSSIPLAEQRKVLSEPSPNERRVILSSSIAETSLTVPGVSVVIDSGLSRTGKIDVRTGMYALETGSESVFSAEQRAGRAGRLGPGRCVRLWAERDVRVSDPAPEILRTDLIAVALECAVWGVADIDGIAWLTRPSEAAWNQARELLSWMGAIEGSGRVTKTGKALVSLGTHPRIAAVALAGGLDLAARYSRFSESPREAARFAEDLARRVARARMDYGVTTDGFFPESLRLSRNADEMKAMPLLAGFPDRIACHVADGSYRFPSGRIASLHRDERNATARYPKWIVAPEVDSGEREGLIRSFETLDDTLATAWLESHATTETRIEFADGKYSPGSKVKKTETRAYGKIVLSERLLAPGPGDVANAVVAAIRENGLAVLPWNEVATRFLARARLCAKAHRMDGARDLSEKSILESLEEWLVPFIPSDGRLDGQGLLDALRYLADGQLVDREVPERITLANGVSRPLAFEELVPGEGPIPILEIRIQDLFGCPDTPRILGMPVLLRLLSPARRPLQVTSDLAGFWKNTWGEVRKEMKGRYPKHKWPEDPFSPEIDKK